MTFCGSFLRLCGYSLVVLFAVLVYFHLECQKENNEKAVNDNIDKEGFNPDITDIEVQLKYCPYGATNDMLIGWEFLLIQFAPCCLTKLHMFISGQSKMYSDMESQPSHNVTIHDARKNNPGSFHESGFTLVELEKEPVTQDWRTSVLQDPHADIINFHKQMEPHIMKLYPETKRILWTYNVVRGGDRFGDQPKAVGSVHLDYYQDDTARIEFHKKWPVMESNISEPMILMGKMDDENGKLGVLLGVWKPLYPEAICDFPLALMDARTLKPENLTPMNLQIKLWPLFTFNNLNGLISYSPDQKLFYYPFQTTREVLIFHQYSKDRWFANAHGSFENKNCPEGSGSRISVEMRVSLYF